MSDLLGDMILQQKNWNMVRKPSPRISGSCRRSQEEWGLTFKSGRESINTALKSFESLKILTSWGEPYEIGFANGKQAGPSIRTNLWNFWAALDEAGLSRGWVVEKMNRCGNLNEDFTDEIRGMARGAGVSFRDLVAFNLGRSLLLPDECTMLMAFGDSTSSGNTLYLKNSDKVGGASLVGEKYYKNKEINVIRIEKFENGRRLVGVSAAGELGIKMGINDKGVASGSNIARTSELKMKKISLTQVRALDRAEILRNGLRYDNALAAAEWALKEVLASPMATPGNVHFVDAVSGYLIEGSYDRAAVQHLERGVAARANAFVILRELNDTEDISSQARYARASGLLNDNKGQLTMEKMIEFSRDHVNGPGMNSICRHDENPANETSLSAAVMEIDRTDQSLSRIQIALGKPCHAWNNADGHITISTRVYPEDIPDDFENGATWKKHYTEVPLDK